MTDILPTYATSALAILDATLTVGHNGNPYDSIGLAARLLRDALQSEDERRRDDIDCPWQCKWANLGTSCGDGCSICEGDGTITRGRLIQITDEWYDARQDDDD